MTVLNGELEDLAGETVVTAIHAYTDPPALDDTRSTAQRRADALVRVCEVALAHTGDDRRAAHHPARDPPRGDRPRRRVSLPGL